MDSKLRKAAILSSVSAVILLLLLVVYSNREKASSTPGWQNNAMTATNRGDVDGANNGIDNGTNSGANDGINSETTDRNNTGAGTGSSSLGPGYVNGQIGDDLSAFLRDETFFDQEVERTPSPEEERPRLSLIVTSIEKDLRIQIVDSTGKPVTGESFYVQLRGLGEYKDLDKDGVIYIGDLAAGEYTVELLPLFGFSIPSNETKVRVKDRVEYVAIEDISLLIKTEAEIDAELEDLQVADATQDADETEIQQLQVTTGKTKVGIDVSKWNKNIDWDKVRDAGVEYAIIRAGYRGASTGSIVEDPFFETNMKGAAASGLPVGVYFFTQAVNEVEAVEEASAVLELIKDYKLEYPVFIDTEGAGGNGRADGLDVETRTLVCEAFCRTIENAGYRAGVYGSRNWFNNRLQVNRLEKYCIWLAEYRSVPLYQGYYRMWQYTSGGSVDGISGKVDMNISYLDQP